MLLIFLKIDTDDIIDVICNCMGGDHGYVNNVFKLLNSLI